MFMQYYVHVVLWFFFFLEGLCDFFCKKKTKKKTQEKEASFYEKETTECK